MLGEALVDVGLGLAQALRVAVPDEQAVQVSVRPLLRLPPRVDLALVQILNHRLRRGLLLYDLDEKRRPRHDRGLVAEVIRHLGVDRVLVGLDDHLQHLARIRAVLLHQSRSDIKDDREGSLGDAVELAALLLVRLKPVNAAERKQTLDTGKHGLDIVRVQELQGDVHITGPLLGEVVVEDLSDQREELLSYRRSSGGERRDETVAKNGLLILGDSGDLGEVLVELP